MGSYVLSRLAQAVVVLLAVAFITFLLLHLSGDPALLLMPPDATRAQVIEFRTQMGFDRPFFEQFFQFLGRILSGDLGYSWRFQEPVLPLVLERLPATALLAVTALIFSLIIAIPVGVISAVKRDTPIDNASMVLALLGQSIPGFWIGIMLIFLFSVKLGWLPTSGWETPQSIILPAVTLGLALVGRNARLVRSSMLEVLGEDYVKAARAKGLSEWRVVNHHALKNALLPVVTVVGLELGILLGGTVVIEVVFAWPGIGMLSVQAVTGRDYPIVQAVILLSAVLFTLTNLAVDLLYTRIDPRIGYK
ncbi:MAG: ABC transporter permease [Pararhodobacter sp.]|nr:ABC transporter permease [Pararhodobacter sp.]